MSVSFVNKNVAEPEKVKQNQPNQPKAIAEEKIEELGIFLEAMAFE